MANVTEKLGTIKDKVSQALVKPEKEGLDALLKYKELLDLGILTEEEFELKKSRF